MAKNFEKLNINDPDAVLEFVHELADKAQAHALKFVRYAERNEQYVQGNQNVEVRSGNNELADIRIDYLPNVTINLLRNIVNTWKARQLKERPSVAAFPTSADPIAIASSEVASKLISYEEKELQIDHLLDEVVGLGALAGIAGFKIFYDPDENTILWQKVSIHDFLIDPSKEDYNTADWCIFKTHIDPYSAKAMLENAGVEEEPPVEVYKLGDNEEQEGVLVLELWHKPTTRLPEGLYCKAIGNHAFDIMSFPNQFMVLETPETPKFEYKLPLVYFKVDPRRGSPYADTWLNDCIQEQRQINEIEAVITNIRRKTGNIEKYAPSDAVAKQMSKKDSIYVLAPDVNGNQGKIGYVPPPQVNPILFSDRELHFQRLYDIAGLNEQLVGVSSIKSGTSAKQLAYLNELDGMKHSGTAKSIQTMLIKAHTLSLQLKQKYYKDERLMRIASDTGGYKTALFRGADIQGITVDLAPRAGLQREAASRIGQVEEDFAAGMVSPEQVLEARTTGQTTSIMEKITRDQIGRDVRSLLQGIQIQMEQDIDPAIAMDEIQKLKASLVGSGYFDAQKAMLLDDLYARYQEKVQRQQQMIQQPVE